MGNTASAFDVALAAIAFEPPACSYPAQGRKTVRTVDGDEIAMQLCAPFSVINREVPSTIEQYQPGKMCVLFSHGNAEDMGQTRTLTQNLADRWGVNVLSYDYVGYGRSSHGTPSEGNMNSAIEAVYQYAVYNLNIPERSILLMGRSIGTAPTVYLASRVHCDVRGTILVSPLASGVRTLAKPRAGALQKMLDALFCPSIHHIQSVHAPVCIVHGMKDSVVPVHNAEELHAAVPQKWRHTPLYVPGAGHNDVMSTYQEAVMHHIEQFMHVCEPADIFEIYSTDDT
jgi:pimeloyl-ACP methyl ester carboxylesterase